MATIHKSITISAPSAPVIAGMIEQGLGAMKVTLESAATGRDADAGSAAGQRPAQLAQSGSPRQ